MLDQLKGVDIGTVYLNDKAVAVFMCHIAEVAREELVESVNLAPFISPKRNTNWLERPIYKLVVLLEV